jgi:hypothetical protein
MPQKLPAIKEIARIATKLDRRYWAPIVAPQS